MNKDYIETWEKFWKPLCVKPDGTLNLDQIQRELHDFHCVMGNVSKVYDHITGGKMSKPNYDADTVIAVYEDHVQDLIAEAMKERDEEACGNAFERDLNEP